MPRVSLHTLGCKLNFAETSTIAREFSRRHYEIVPFGEPADVTVINTCTVTEQAEQKCRNIVRRAVSASPEAFVVVTGCYAQLRPDEIAAIDGVDLVAGNAEKSNLFDLAAELEKGAATQVAVSCIDDVEQFGPAYSASERTRAFMKIQDGCDYSCSFCTIPAARGKSRSASIEETLGHAREIAEAGFKEIVLSGVNVGLFGEQRGESLLQLLERLVEVDGIERIRISSIEPNLLTDEIIDFAASSDKMMPHFHIPLQSGDDTVLGLMRRRYRSHVYADRAARIMSVMPDACIGVDVIVGSPGETEAAFENTAAFIADLPVGYLHVFTYSERPDTAARELVRSGQISVPVRERKRRNKILRALSDRKRRAHSERFVGLSRPVLWEGGHHDSVMHGFTDNYIKVTAPYDSDRIGRVEDVTLDCLEDDGSVRVDDGFVTLEEAMA